MRLLLLVRLLLPPGRASTQLCFEGVATSGTLAYPSNVVVSSLDYVDALDLDITAGTT